MSAQKRLLRKVKKSSGCWLWQGATDTYGYGNIYCDGSYWKAHRLSYAIFISDIPDGFCVLHKCDTPACVNPKHLFVGTRQDNMDDMYTKGRGRKASGVNHHMVNIDYDIANQIKGEYVRGVTRQVDLASRFGVSQGVISSIIRGAHWTQRGDQSSQS